MERSESAEAQAEIKVKEYSSLKKINAIKQQHRYKMYNTTDESSKTYNPLMDELFRRMCYLALLNYQDKVFKLIDQNPDMMIDNVTFERY